MTEISVTLVRKHNIAKDVDSLMTLDTICLDDLGIEEIDNLEVFDQVRELKLSSNKITAIQNLEYLQKLETIDLSYNSIDLTALEHGLNNVFPKSVRYIDISGNPCTSDSSALQLLQDKFPRVQLFCNSCNLHQNGRPNSGSSRFTSNPNSRAAQLRQATSSSMDSRSTGIALSSTKNELLESEVNALTLDNNDDNDDNNDTSSAAWLDPDEVVREIVARKCMRQNVEREIRDLTKPISKNSASNSSDAKDESQLGDEVEDNSNTSHSAMMDDIKAETEALSQGVDVLMNNQRTQRAQAIQQRLHALDLAQERRKANHIVLVQSVTATTDDADSKGSSSDRTAPTEKTQVAPSDDKFMSQLRMKANVMRNELMKG